MADVKRITTPLTEAQVAELRAGDQVLISGVIYTARDAAHKRLTEALERGEELPIPLEGSIIYYVGPTPPKPGQVIGSAGPTTSGRMDKYTPTLLSKGLKGVIGKGYRSSEVKDSFVENRAVYMVSTGGAGALLARTIKDAQLVAYEDLGTEAIRRLVVEDFPAVVIHDQYGGDQYAEGQKAWRRP